MHQGASLQAYDKRFEPYQPPKFIFILLYELVDLHIAAEITGFLRKFAALNLRLRK
jgi:hypothetical protein